MGFDRPLEWIQRNRTRRQRLRSVGVPVTRLVERLSETEGVPVQAVAEAVADRVDDVFRAHCRLDVTRGRTLVVYVDRPAMVYSMRLQWHAALRKVLAERGFGSRIRRIEFVYDAPGLQPPIYR